MKKIVFTGGGTAGHIMPNLALIQNLKNYKIYYQHELDWQWTRYYIFRNYEIFR